jgi:hypothetical protein
MSKIQFCPHGHDTFVIGRLENWYCRGCNNERSKKFRRQHKSRSKENLWKYYGIVNKDGSRFTIKDYSELFRKQRGRCAVCGTPQYNLKKALSVDHDHKTGVVRGLLCNTHNRVLGLLQDNIKDIKAFIGYLRQQTLRK